MTTTKTAPKTLRIGAVTLVHQDTIDGIECYLAQHGSHSPYARQALGTESQRRRRDAMRSAVAEKLKSWVPASQVVGWEER